MLDTSIEYGVFQGGHRGSQPTTELGDPPPELYNCVNSADELYGDADDPLEVPAL